jgi:hypothetical protein
MFGLFTTIRLIKRPKKVILITIFKIVRNTCAVMLCTTGNTKIVFSPMLNFLIININKYYTYDTNGSVHSIACGLTKVKVSQTFKTNFDGTVECTL